MRSHPRREPSDRLLTELAYALEKAHHRNIAEHLLAGLLWAIYPEWFNAKWERKSDAL